MDAQKHQGQVKKVEVAESTPTENLPVLVETLDK